MERSRCVFPAVKDVPVFATILHLVLSEWLPIWLFYVAYYTLLTESNTYLYLWYMDVNLADLSGLALQPSSTSQSMKGIETLGEYLFCVQNEMNMASWTLNLNYQGRCVSLRNDYNLLGLTNYFCLFVCCGLVISSICTVLWNEGSDICTGKYLATKWRFEKTRLFHCLAVVLVFMVVTCFLITAFVSGSTLKSGAPLVICTSDNDYFVLVVMGLFRCVSLSSFGKCTTCPLGNLKIFRPLNDNVDSFLNGKRTKGISEVDRKHQKPVFVQLICWDVHPHRSYSIKVRFKNINKNNRWIPNLRANMWHFSFEISNLQ